MKLWHKIAIGAAAALLLIAAVPFLIPLGAYRGQIETLATRAAGREVTIAGPLSLTFVPEFGLSAKNVTVANVPGARAPHLLTLDTLVVGAKFWPLLKGRLEVTRITLEKPVVRLERNASGAGNWESTRGDDGEGGFAVMRRLGISDITVHDGSLAYMTPEGAPFVATGIELVLILPETRALTVAGEMIWRGEEFSLEGDIADPDALFADGASAAQLGIGSDIGGGRFAGRLNLKGRSDGTLRLSSSSLRDAAIWAGLEVPPGDQFDRGEDPYGSFDFEGGVMVDASKLMLTGIRLRLERLDIQGVLALDWTGELPMLTGEVGLRRFNIDSYLTLSDDVDEDAIQDPDTARLNLAFLKQINAKLKLHLRSVIAAKLLIDQAIMELTCQDGVLKADLADLELYDGRGTASMEIDASGEVPVFKENLALERVRMSPLLADLVEVDRIDGDGALTLELTGRGDTEQAILSSLAGSGKFRVVGGNISGANLIGVAQAVKDLLGAETLAGALGETRGTDFSELAASFTIKDGVARTDDIALVHTAFRMTGRGSVDFAQRSLDLSLEPRVPANGRFSLPDLGIPFKVTGPWDRLSYRPDLARLPAGVMRGLESLLGR